MESLKKQEPKRKLEVSPLALILNAVGTSFISSIQPSLKNNEFARNFIQLARNSRMIMDALNRNKSTEEFASTTTKAVKFIESKCRILFHIFPLKLKIELKNREFRAFRNKWCSSESIK